MSIGNVFTVAEKTLIASYSTVSYLQQATFLLKFIYRRPLAAFFGGLVTYTLMGIMWSFFTVRFSMLAVKGGLFGLSSQDTLDNMMALSKKFTPDMYYLSYGGVPFL